MRILVFSLSFLAGFGLFFLVTNTTVTFKEEYFMAGFKERLKGRRQSSNVVDHVPPKEYSNMTSQEWVQYKTKNISEKASKSPVPVKVTRTVRYGKDGKPKN